MKTKTKLAAIVLMIVTPLFAQPKWQVPAGWDALKPADLTFDKTHLVGLWSEQKSGVRVLMIALPAYKTDADVRDSVAGAVAGDLKAGHYPTKIAYFSAGELEGFHVAGPLAAADADYWFDVYIFVGLDASYQLQVVRKSQSDAFDIAPWLVDITPNKESVTRLRLLEKQLNSDLPHIQQQAESLQKIVRAKRVLPK